MERVTRLLAKHVGALLFYAVAALLLVHYPSLISDAIIGFVQVAEAIVHIIVTTLHVHN